MTMTMEEIETMIICLAELASAQNEKYDESLKAIATLQSQIVSLNDMLSGGSVSLPASECDQSHIPALDSIHHLEMTLFDNGSVRKKGVTRFVCKLEINLAKKSGLEKRDFICESALFEPSSLEAMLSVKRIVSDELRGRVCGFVERMPPQMRVKVIMGLFRRRGGKKGTEYFEDAFMVVEHDGTDDRIVSCATIYCNGEAFSVSKWHTQNPKTKEPFRIATIQAKSYTYVMEELAKIAEDTFYGTTDR